MSDNEHIQKLQRDESHQGGEENGCVTRCVYEKNSTGRWVCQYKGHNYRENGFNYQKVPEAEWYNLPIHEEGSEAQRRFKEIFATPFRQWWRDPLRNAKAWYMGDGPYAGLNFIGSGAWPWSNNAHHIVPVGDVLSKVLQDRLLLLQQAKYNVNKGVNIIYLPNRTRHATLFQLLKHPKYHSTYSADIRQRVESIRETLEEGADPEENGHPQLNEKTVPLLGEQLHAFSLRTRKKIREAGIKEPGAHINDLARLVSIR